MSRTRLLVLFGGVSSEHEISIRSAKSVLEAVDRGRFDPLVVGIRRDGSWRTAPADRALEDVIAHGDIVADLRALAPDVVFPVLHGPHGEDGTMQGLLEVLGLAYVGSGVLASAVCMDKAVQKHVVAQAAPDVALVPWIEADVRRDSTDAIAREVEAELGFPCFVKPASLGSSVGVHRVTDAAALAPALADAGRYDHKLVVERGVDGAREIEVAILGDGGAGTIASAPGEIGLPDGVWYDYDTKYVNDVATLHIPAQLPDAIARTVSEHALAAFRACGCHGLARIDFLLDRGSGTAYLNELNTMPGFTSISMYPKLMEHTGVPYRELITRLCDLALARKRDKAALSVER